MPSATRFARASIGAATAALVLVSFLPGDGQAQAQDPKLERLVGVYRFVGGHKEVREVERAIDEAVDEMNVFIRGIARRRLKEPNLPTDEVRISAQSDLITVARSGQPSISAPVMCDQGWASPGIATGSRA